MFEAHHRPNVQQPDLSAQTAEEPPTELITVTRVGQFLGIHIASSTSAAVSGLFVHHIEPYAITQGPRALMVGDRIVEIDGINCRSATQADVGQLIGGKDCVQLRVFHDQQLLSTLCSPRTRLPQGAAQGALLSGTATQALPLDLQQTVASTQSPPTVQLAPVQPNAPPSTLPIVQLEDRAPRSVTPVLAFMNTVPLGNSSLPITAGPTALPTTSLSAPATPQRSDSAASSPAMV